MITQSVLGVVRIIAVSKRFSSFQQDTAMVPNPGAWRVRVNSLFIRHQPVLAAGAFLLPPESAQYALAILPIIASDPHRNHA